MSAPRHRSRGSRTEQLTYHRRVSEVDAVNSASNAFVEFPRPPSICRWLAAAALIGAGMAVGVAVEPVHTETPAVVTADSIRTASAYGCQPSTVELRSAGTEEP